MVFPSPAAAAVFRHRDDELAEGWQLGGQPPEFRIDLVGSVEEEVDGVDGGGVTQQLLEVDEQRRLLRRNALGRLVEVVRELEAN